jgi:nucleoside-diphosphate-sugar epimerase
MNTAADVVQNDLNYICSTNKAEFETMSGQRLLITGGAGFLGYYLVQSITHWNRNFSPDRKIDVVVWDNFSRGVPAWLTSLREAQQVTLAQRDLRDPLPADMGDFGWIVHAASIASPTIYRQDPIGTMDANIVGLRNLLDYALRQKNAGRPVRGFLFFSSSEIYGDPDPANIPTPETYRGYVSCTGPRACYDEAKRYGETLCVNFHRQHGIAVKCARPFNNYGPGLKITDGRVLPDFCRNVLAGEDIVMLSDGLAKRTFCYDADSVMGYYRVLVNGGGGEAYNIGVETPEISMRELADRVVALAQELVGYRGKVVQKTSGDPDYLVDNPNRRCPIIAKARQQIGYHPTVTLDEGLRRSLLWYRENRS